MARRLALQGQGLDGQWKLPSGREGAAQAIERLGYVQIDTIAVIQRAHHHVLWSRCGDYRPEMLHDLLATDRRVFEYWTHAASYVPLCDYRYYLPRMNGFAKSPRMRHWRKSNKALVKHVLGRLRKEGPLSSSEFKAPEGFKRGTWWSWKPAKQALEHFFTAGEVMVTERRNFQRVYGLTEQVLPTGTDTSTPTREELGCFLVRRALGGFGVASVADLRWRRGNRQLIADTLEELTRSGEVTPVRVRGWGDEPCFALTELLEQISPRSRPRKRVHILSPFDNLVIWRRRLQRLFGFDYSLECYTPEKKRRYGYFCLPILYGDRFVGRLDPKADRKQKKLIVKKLMLEPDVKGSVAMLRALATKLHAFAAFNDCESVSVERTRPATIRTALRQELRR